MRQNETQNANYGNKNQADKSKPHVYKVFTARSNQQHMCNKYHPLSLLTSTNLKVTFCLVLIIIVHPTR